MNFSLKAFVSRLFKIFEIDVYHFEIYLPKTTWFLQMKIGRIFINHPAWQELRYFKMSILKLL